MVRINRCSSPLSPTALRAALIRLLSVEFGDDPTAPDRGDQIVLADHTVAVAHQIEQQIEHLRLDRDQLRAPPEFAAFRIKYMIFKTKLHVSRP